MADGWRLKLSASRAASDRNPLCYDEQCMHRDVCFYLLIWFGSELHQATSPSRLKAQVERCPIRGSHWYLGGHDGRRIGGWFNRDPCEIYLLSRRDPSCPERIMKMKPVWSRLSIQSPVFGRRQPTFCDTVSTSVSVYYVTTMGMCTSECSGDVCCCSREKTTSMWIHSSNSLLSSM